MTDPASSSSHSGDDAYCINYGYDLRMRPSGKCPECGTRFDRNDPNSFSSHAPKSPEQRRERRDMRWNGAGFSFIGLVIAVASVVGATVDRAPLGALPGILVGACLVMFGAPFLMQSFRPVPSSQDFVHRPAVALIIVSGLVIMVVLTIIGWLFGW